LRLIFGAIGNRHAAASDGGAPGIAALAGCNGSKVYRSNYCAVDLEIQTFCEKPGVERAF